MGGRRDDGRGATISTTRQVKIAAKADARLATVDP